MTWQVNNNSKNLKEDVSGQGESIVSNTLSCLSLRFSLSLVWFSNSFCLSQGSGSLRLVLISKNVTDPGLGHVNKTSPRLGWRQGETALPGTALPGASGAHFLLFLAVGLWGKGGVWGAGEFHLLFFVHFCPRYMPCYPLLRLPYPFPIYQSNI